MTRTVSASQSNYCTARVTGREPFFVPSQPGIATEKRPGGAAGHDHGISSVDGNLEIMVSGPGRDSVVRTSMCFSVVLVGQQRPYGRRTSQRDGASGLLRPSVVGEGAGVLGPTTSIV